MTPEERAAEINKTWGLLEDEVHDITVAIRAAEAAAFRQGAEAFRDVAVSQAQEWFDAYPEDIFIGDLGKIGRHVASHIRDEIRNLPLPEPPAAAPEREP